MKQSHELNVLITEMIALSLDAISNNSFVFHATNVVFPHSILFLNSYSQSTSVKFIYFSSSK